LSPEAISNCRYTGFGHTDLPYHALAVHDGDVVPVIPKRLNFARASADSVQLTWPTVYANHVLDYATSLPAAGWTTVTNQATTNANRLSITVPTDASQRFYRLRQP